MLSAALASLIAHVCVCSGVMRCDMEVRVDSRDERRDRVTEATDSFGIITKFVLASCAFRNDR